MANRLVHVFSNLICVLLLITLLFLLITLQVLLIALPFSSNNYLLLLETFILSKVIFMHSISKYGEFNHEYGEYFLYCYIYLCTTISDISSFLFFFSSIWRISMSLWRIIRLMYSIDSSIITTSFIISLSLY